MQPPGAAIPYNVGRRAAIGVQTPRIVRDVQHATPAQRREIAARHPDASRGTAKPAGG
ncbi:hypothetical protein [Nitrobacter sp.]|uniref:hypothetical protein n=1 Tax=Nitrobacter sp. TaxID=29420 RepID=UPI0029CAB737|nr:hypothetical protein [Nitrobacter sp.]